jgi:uncharacterized membrane protein
MNSAHWHLLVNHLPIIFPIVGAMVMVMGIISKSEAVKRTAFTIFIIGALTSIAAMSTGEGAEEVLEKIDGAASPFIGIHEETAETFAVLSYILGGISVLGLWVSFKKEKFSLIVSIVTLIFSLVVLFFAKQTGTTGGEIRHTEIRSGNMDPAAEKKSSEADDD